MKMTRHGSSKRRTAATIAGFLEHVQEIQKQWFPKDDEPYGLWYRGHQKAHWQLTPKLYRDYGDRRRRNDHRIEDEIREDFITRAPVLSDIKPAVVDDWEWYFLMQHFGAPTRLLDWTQGALIALYFAVRDNPGFYDAAVWVLDPYELNKHVIGKDEVIPPSANVDLADKKIVDRWLPGRFPQKRKLLPRDPIAVLPTHIAHRIKSQLSCFTIHGEDEFGLDKFTLGKKSCVQRILIPHSEVLKIRSELNICGIDESTIFPDLEGLARVVGDAWKSKQRNSAHERVHTRLAPSLVDKGGVGVFAIVDIAKGTRLFEGDNEEMLWAPAAIIKKAPAAIRRLYRDFAVFKDNLFGCPLNFNRLTMSWYINDSKNAANANVYATDEYDFVARRNIKAGEELLVDYSSYSAPPPAWLGR
ncbi:MAG: FRG domain-containing protein [Verrucomicrobiia bacterium]|jgi:hypothetical protein